MAALRIPGGRVARPQMPRHPAVGAKPKKIITKALQLGTLLAWRCSAGVIGYISVSGLANQTAAASSAEAALRKQAISVSRREENKMAAGTA